MKTYIINKNKISIMTNGKYQIFENLKDYQMDTLQELLQMNNYTQIII